jgi:hypothetical protein
VVEVRDLRETGGETTDIQTPWRAQGAAVARLREQSGTAVRGHRRDLQCRPLGMSNGAPCAGLGVQTRDQLTMRPGRMTSGRTRLSELGKRGELGRTREVSERAPLLIQLGLDESDHGIGAAGQAEYPRQIERRKLRAEIG